ncbi:hypothetical protein B0H10DRAFT_2426922 [Mycena sp. CBHHK59/15]|nr:hypothetical protein B0H10DRAFT_2426922 [Mycena sp. CBHHK59/15]
MRRPKTPLVRGNSATLLPRRWKATSSISVQLNVVAAGTTPVQRTNPPRARLHHRALIGRLRVTTVTTPSSATPAHQLSRGKTAAAILLPRRPPPAARARTPRRPSAGAAHAPRLPRQPHLPHALEQDDAAPPVPALPSPSRMSAYGGKGADGGYDARAASPTGRVHTINYPTPSSPSPPYSAHTSSPSTGSSTPRGARGEPPADCGPAYVGAGGYTQANDGLRRVWTPSFVRPFTSPPAPFSALWVSASASPLPPSLRLSSFVSSHLPSSPLPAVRPPPAPSLNAHRHHLALPLVNHRRTQRDPDSAHPAVEDDPGDYLFASAMPETVFAYTGAPGPMTPVFSSVGSASTLGRNEKANGRLDEGTTNTASTSPFAMPMSAATMSHDDMLQYAATHAASTGSSHNC